jgi:hypothetical protein
VRHGAGRLPPVVEKRALELGDRGSDDAEVGVAPVLGVLRVTEPLVGDPHAAGEPDVAIDHQQLAVGAVVEPADRVPARLVVPTELNARILHLLQIRLIDLAAADPVDQDMDLHPGPGALGKRIRKRLANRARPVDVRLERDGVLRGADCLQHGREDLFAVEQRLHPVPVRQGRSEHDPHGAEKLRVGDGVQVLRAQVDLLVAKAEVHPQHSDRHRGDDRADDDPGVLVELHLDLRSHDLRVRSGVSRAGAIRPESAHGPSPEHVACHRSPRLTHPPFPPERLSVFRHRADLLLGPSTAGRRIRRRSSRA